MTIYQIYSKYNIMPSLQLHMFRVAAVAKIVSDNSKVKVDKENILKACLLHDMGNIIKFNLSYDPELLRPQGKSYWEKVKKKFTSKYGNNEREASIKIAKECKVNKNVIELVGATGFRNGKPVLHSKNIDKMICLYSDMRVGPDKIVSLEDRFLEGLKRHFINKQKIANNGDFFDDKEFFNETCKSILDIENLIFENEKIKPTEITSIKVAEIVHSDVFENIKFP